MTYTFKAMIIGFVFFSSFVFSNYGAIGRNDPCSEFSEEECRQFDLSGICKWDAGEQKCFLGGGTMRSSPIPSTSKEIEVFQKFHGLEPSGTMDEPTMRKLHEQGLEIPKF